MSGLDQIEAQRAEAKAALAEAEAAMLAQSADARAFAKAKRARQDAEEALERLQWAEKAERERQAAEARQAKVDRLREVQDAARRAHAEAVNLDSQLGKASGDIVAVLRAMRAAQEVVTVAVNHEAFAVRDGLLPRPTVEARVRVDREAAVTALRAARELCTLAGMSRQAAEQQADQRRI